MQKYTQRFARLATLPFGKWSLLLLAANLLTVVAALAAKSVLPPVVPLFFGKPYGAEQLTSQGSLAIPGLAAFIINILSLIISSLTEDDFIRKVLFGCIVAGTALSLIATVKIIFLVGSI